MGVPQVNNTSNDCRVWACYVETNRVISSSSSLVEGESDEMFSSVRANERSAVDCSTVVATPAPCSSSLQRSSHSGVVLGWSGPAPSFFLPQRLGVGRARWLLATCQGTDARTDPGEGKEPPAVFIGAATQFRAKTARGTAHAITVSGSGVFGFAL